jgi:hypothetical protein
MFWGRCAGHSQGLLTRADVCTRRQHTHLSAVEHAQAWVGQQEGWCCARSALRSHAPSHAHVVRQATNRGRRPAQVIILEESEGLSLSLSPSLPLSLSPSLPLFVSLSLSPPPPPPPSLPLPLPVSLPSSLPPFLPPFLIPSLPVPGQADQDPRHKLVV